MSAYALSVLLLKRSVLTEKMPAAPTDAVVHPDETLREVANKLAEGYVTRAPVIDRRPTGPADRVHACGTGSCE